MDSRGVEFLAKQHMATAILLALSWAVMVFADPNPLQDFCVADQLPPNNNNNNYRLDCKEATEVLATDFKSSILQTSAAANASGTTTGVIVTVASAATFPALNTQSLSITRVDFAPAGLLPPHVHPRASEVLYVVEGALTAAFIDTNNTLFSALLEAGDLFVIPRGLVHYVMNEGDAPAVSISGLDSQNPGVSLLPEALFATSPPLPDAVLQNAFKLSQDQVDALKAAIAIARISY